MTGSEQMGESDTHTSAPLNIYQRHLRACAVIDSMPWIKDQSNPQFKSVPIDAMRAGVRKACITAGMVHHGPYAMDYVREVEVRKDKFGNEVGKTFRFHGEAKFRLINVDDPSDFMEWEVLGESMDTGDKGMGKLESSFIKNFYKAAFDIGEKGDDNDSVANEEFDRFIQEKRAESEKAHQKEKAAEAGMEKRYRQILDNADSPVVKAFLDKNGRDPKRWSDLDVFQCLSDLEDARVPDFKTGEELAEGSSVSGTVIPTEQEMAQFINVKGALPAFKETVRGFKQAHGAMTAFDLSYDEKVELYTLLMDMGAGQ